MDMSLATSFIIAAVFVARIFLKRLPKIYSYALWAVVLFRLLCPFAIELNVSTPVDIPVADRIQEYVTQPMDVQMEVDADAMVVEAEKDTLDYTVIAAYIWLAGVFTMCVVGAYRTLALKKRIATAVLLEDNVYETDQVLTPFVMGLLRPAIYLPVGLLEGEKEYILLHERHHISRGDHITRFLASVARSLHWFNPLVHIAFHLSAKDMEMSCDEAVIAKLGADIRGDYAASLLKLSMDGKLLTGATLAFGEKATVSRIKNLASLRNPGMVIRSIAVMVVLILAVLFALKPQEQADPGYTAYHRLEVETAPIMADQIHNYEYLSDVLSKGIHVMFLLRDFESNREIKGNLFSTDVLYDNLSYTPVLPGEGEAYYFDKDTLFEALANRWLFCPTKQKPDVII